MLENAGDHAGARVDADDTGPLGVEGQVAAGAHAGIEYDAGNAREQLRPHGPLAVILERQID